MRRYDWTTKTDLKKKVHLSRYDWKTRDHTILTTKLVVCSPPKRYWSKYHTWIFRDMEIHQGWVALKVGYSHWQSMNVKLTWLSSIVVVLYPHFHWGSAFSIGNTLTSSFMLDVPLSCEFSGWVLFPKLNKGGFGEGDFFTKPPFGGWGCYDLPRFMNGKKTYN